MFGASIYKLFLLTKNELNGHTEGDNMAGINRIFLIGRLGKDPEMKSMPNGTAITNFSIATSEEWKDKLTGEKKEKTEWHRVVTFRRLAEVCGEWLGKGSQVYIEGRLQTREWEKDGVKRYTTEIVADKMQMLGGKGDRRDEPARVAVPQGDYQNNRGPDGYKDDSIPF